VQTWLHEWVHSWLRNAGSCQSRFPAKMAGPPSKAPRPAGGDRGKRRAPAPSKSRHSRTPTTGDVRGKTALRNPRTVGAGYLVWSQLHICTPGRTKLTMHCAGDTSAGNDAPEKLFLRSKSYIYWFQKLTGTVSTPPGLCLHDGESGAVKKRRRTTEKIHEDTHFFAPPLPPQTVLPPRPTQNHVRKQTKWKNVFPCKASLTTNVPTSLVGKKSKSKWERGTALPLSKSAMRPTRNISIMHTMITIMRLAIVFFRFASGATQRIAVRNFYVQEVRYVI